MVAIRAEGLGKRYRLGATTAGYRTLSETIAGIPRRFLRQRAPSRRGPELWALRDASFEVAEGEAVGVIGPNGAGKSTLLKLLSRVTEPTEGRAEVHGRVGSLLEVGTGFHPELSGRENVLLSGAILGMRRHEIDARYRDIVAFAGLEEFMDTPVKRYSSGMYVRLGFAVAAHLEPEILLVDEILAVGDHQFQQKCLGRMSERAEGGRTVLFVSHNMEAVAKLTRRCILVSKGRVLMDGPTSDVIRAYLQDAELRAQGSVVDLREIPRGPHAATDLRLAWLSLTDASTGQPQPAFPEGETVRVMVGFEILRPVRQFEITCTISTMTGVRLFSVASGRQRWTLEPGSYAVSCDLAPNHLRPGLYSLSLGVSTGAWQDGGYDLATLRVSENPGGSPWELPTNGQFGFLGFPYRWNEPRPLASHGMGTGHHRVPSVVP